MISVVHLLKLVRICEHMPLDSNLLCINPKESWSVLASVCFCTAYCHLSSRFKTRQAAKSWFLWLGLCDSNPFWYLYCLKGKTHVQSDIYEPDPNQIHVVWNPVKNWLFGIDLSEWFGFREDACVMPSKVCKISKAVQIRRSEYMSNVINTEKSKCLLPTSM